MVRTKHTMAQLKIDVNVDIDITSERFANMDLTAFSSVGTQTPTEDRCFEFPECFTPSPQMSSVSSIGTQTGVRSKASFEFPDTAGSSIRTSHRPKLFRRHSTGSDVYNFSSSPTLITAFGGIMSRRMHAEDRLSSRITSGSHVKGTLSKLEDTNEECEDVETVGQQLREIGDDLDRGGSFRSRSASVSRFFVNVRRRTSSSSS